MQISVAVHVTVDSIVDVDVICHVIVYVVDVLVKSQSPQFDRSHVLESSVLESSVLESSVLESSVLSAAGTSSAVPLDSTSTVVHHF